MFKSRKSLLIMALAALAVVAYIQPAFADRLADAISATPKGAEAGQINTELAPGFLGIPGGPSVNLVIGFVWAIWVGWIFSTVGAFGGIMAGVGHITIYGFGNYASTFKKTSPVMNKLVTDSIRVSNQWLVGTSAAMSSFNYYKMGRLVLPLGLSLAAGSIAGSYLVPWLTAGKVSLKAYIGFFGLFVLALGCYLFYETTPKGQAGKKQAKEAAKAFEASIKDEKEGAKVDTAAMGVKVVSFAPTKCIFTFYGVEFSFNPLIPVVGGFIIAALASFLGVGGGFLLVPFLTSVAGLPMYLVAGTSALAVLVGMTTSVFTYMVVKDTPVFWPLIGVELLGILVGSFIGPRTSKYIPDVWLKRLFVVLALYVGIRYSSKGFLGYSLLPPF
ncbi:sulfite exporter TauE/SafE family protein [Desulfovibrio sp. JC022]|uniref:sulfite exporter TauE/SafE family protein n=1 Tax=Desulfovibrio sp. JC022 TaxID=2593642 RepID=UPI0013D2A56A|nr:sulfite exporter TauE/SafE family protein [Desulfovibrio sp. JC022]NDV21791.1 sulfite exporter TauE/SafE family protein [Desulfovibrio sp. JC022]